jgi:hypothetical protein
MLAVRPRPSLRLIRPPIKLAYARTRPGARMADFRVGDGAETCLQ